MTLGRHGHCRPTIPLLSPRGGIEDQTFHFPQRLTLATNEINPTNIVAFGTASSIDQSPRSLWLSRPGSASDPSYEPTMLSSIFFTHSLAPSPLHTPPTPYHPLSTLPNSSTLTTLEPCNPDCPLLQLQWLFNYYLVSLPLY